MEEELPSLNASSTSVWIGQYRKLMNLGYTHTNLLSSLRYGSYVCVAQYSTYLDKKISIKRLGEEATEFNAIKNAVRSTNKKRNKNIIVLHLNKTYRAKLRSILKNHGFDDSQDRNVGISNAFARYLDTV